MTKELIELSDLDAAIEADLSNAPRKNAQGKTVTDYVDNKKLYEELKTYIHAYREAKENGQKLPRVPEYIGHCIMLIAQRMATRPNFANYSYREDMIGDGILNALKYIHNFNPDKGNNPFGYISRQVWNSFLARIEEEKGEYATKIKKLNQYGLIEEAFETQDQDDDGEFHNTYVEHLQNNNDFLTDFEQKLDRKRRERRTRRSANKVGLETFMQDDENEDSDIQ